MLFFSPLSLGRYTLAYILIMAPMTRSGAANEPVCLPTL